MSEGRQRRSSADRFILLAACELRVFDRFVGDDQALRLRLKLLESALRQSFDEAEGSKRRLAGRFFAVCALEYRTELERLIKASLQSSAKADETAIKLLPLSAQLVFSVLSPLELLLAIGQHSRVQCMSVREAPMVQQKPNAEQVLKISKRLLLLSDQALDYMSDKVECQIECYKHSRYFDGDERRPSVYGLLTDRIRRSRYRYDKQLKRQINLELMRRDPGKVAMEKIFKAVSRRKAKFDRDFQQILLELFLSMDDEDLIAFQSMFSRQLQEMGRQRKTDPIHLGQTGPVPHEAHNNIQLPLSHQNLRRSFQRAYRARGPF